MKIRTLLKPLYVAMLMVPACGDSPTPTPTPTPETFSLGGTVNGLQGEGLVLASNGQILTVPRDGTSFAFPDKLARGAEYNVTITTQPSSPAQECSVAGGTGTVVAGDVTSVVVNCTTLFTVGGTVSGLDGEGLVLQNNGGTNVTISANGTFAFPTLEMSGAAYDVTVLTQPTNRWQTCAVVAGTGNVATQDVSDIEVHCETNQYTVRGTISGLLGSGMVLQNSGGDNLGVDAGASTFEFPMTVASMDPYLVTVLTQPGGPAQECVVAGGAGTITNADVNVEMNCTTRVFQVSVNVSGLPGAGLVVRNNGGDDLAIAADGTHTFATGIESGGDYDVTVLEQPAGGRCVVSAPANGTVDAFDVTVDVVCAPFKLVFVSSSAHSGNLGGVAGADAICQGLATNAGLPGTYRAWISDTLGNSPSSRFARSTSPYARVDGTVVANDWADLTDGSIAAAINLTETGGAPPVTTAVCGSTQPVRSHTSASGDFSPYGNGTACDNWTATTSQTNHHFGSFGQTTNGYWASGWCGTGGTCDLLYPMYCFQQ